RRQSPRDFLLYFTERRARRGVHSAYAFSREEHVDKGYLSGWPEEVLLYVPHYDFRWQETYFLKKQFLLPKGTKLMTVAYFDNSKNNFQNPDPSKSIRWGEPSDEEMMGFWLQFADPAVVSASAEK